MDESDQENNNSIEMRSTQQRKLCYRDLLNRIEDIQESEDVGIRTIREVGNILKRANLLNDECDIQERVNHADETLLDTMVLAEASGILMKCVEAVDISTTTYEPGEFCARLLESIQNEEDEEINLLTLIDDARKTVPQVQPFLYLFGTYDFTKVPQPKEKKQRKQQVKEKVEKKMPILISKQQEKEEKGVLDIVNFLVRVLQTEYEKNDNNPIEYFKFVIDKSDFGATVENIFYCSFLVRDGKAKLHVDENGVATLEPMRKRELKLFRKSGGLNTQMISSITMDNWQKSSIKEGHIQRHRNHLNKTKSIQ